MAKKAVTVTAYALIPVDDYDLRLGEILSEFERGLQQAGAEYIGPFERPGIPAEMSDHLWLT